MRFEVVDEGYVSERRPNRMTPVASGPRCVVVNESEVVCSFNANSARGVNGFIPILARSQDGGKTWTEQGMVWPESQQKRAIYCSLSQGPNRDLFLYGTITPIDSPGETDWCEATHGMKANQLFWARSVDQGLSWTLPTPIPMPILGAAEAPGPMCVTRTGRWLVCYAPSNTFDPNLKVDLNQIVALRSDDQGKTWRHNSMLRFADIHSGAGEAWVIELTDGRLLGTCWQINLSDGSDYPNPYAISLDCGSTWQPTRSTSILGQSTALAALPNGRALFVYNQRRHGELGVWLAVVRPTDSAFGIEHNEIVWRAETATQRGTSVDHFQWQDFAFGEPSAVVLPDGLILVTLWCIQPSGQGICYVRLRIVD